MDTPTPVTVLKLEHPVKWGDETVSELPLYRLKTKVLKGMPKDDFSQITFLVGRSAQQPPTFIDELDGKDLFAAKDIVFNFLGLSPETGKMSSDGSPIE